MSMVSYGYGLHCIYTKKWILMQIDYVKGFGMAPNIITTWSGMYSFPYLFLNKIKILSNSNDKIKESDKTYPCIDDKLAYKQVGDSKTSLFVRKLDD
jgi:hypothetical protein